MMTDPPAHIESFDAPTFSMFAADCTDISGFRGSCCATTSSASGISAVLHAGHYPAAQRPAKRSADMSSGAGK